MAMLLWGSPSGDDFTWDLTYKFKTDDGVLDESGAAVGYAKFSQPVRELKFSIGAEQDDSFDRLSAFLVAGATFVTVPMWFLRTNILETVTPGMTYFKVADSSEMLVGDQVLFLRSFQPSICELMTIESITGGVTINTTSPFVYEHHPFNMPAQNGDAFDTLCSYAIPTLTGTLEYESLDFIDGLPGISMKAKVDGGAWQSFTMPSMPSFLDVAMDAKYNVPKITRDLCGVENGILVINPYGDSSKLTFECTWNFKDSNWKLLRDMFCAVRGKASIVNMSTFMYELSTTRGADEGSTIIFLDSGYQYLYQRFPNLLVYSRMTGDQFMVHITGYVSGDQFTCDAISNEIWGGERVCFYPQVRFDSDDLTFSFKGLNMCYVKATFIEELQS